MGRHGTSCVRTSTQRCPAVPVASDIEKVVNAGARVDTVGHIDGGAKASLAIYAWFMEWIGFQSYSGD